MNVLADRFSFSRWMLVVFLCGCCIQALGAPERTGSDDADRIGSAPLSGTTYLIDGTTYSTFSDLPELADGDRIEIDPAHIIYEGEVLLEHLNWITITRKAGTSGYAVKRNAHSVVMSTLVSSGEFDVWRSDVGSVGAKPETVWEEWDNPLNVDANGFHTAYLHENLVGLSDLETNRSWKWDGNTRSLYVSVPAGVDASKQQYLAGIRGHGLVLKDMKNCVVEHISFELTTEAGATKGYGFRETFSSSLNVVRNCRFRANQYHGLGSVSNVCNFTSMNNDIAESYAGSDSQLVFFSRLGATQNARSVDDTFHMVPWLDVEGAPHRNQKIIAIGAHKDYSAPSTHVGGIQIINPTCLSYGYDLNGHYVFLSLGAVKAGHNPPSVEDELDPLKYPILVSGGYINISVPAQIGGNISTNNAAAFVGTRFDVDCSQLFAATPGAGCFSSICGHNSDLTNSTLALFSCTISAKMPPRLTEQTLFATKSFGARLILENCSIQLVGQSPAQQRLFLFSSTAGLTRVHGCVIDTEDPNTRLCMGNAETFRNDPNRFSFQSNMYSSVLNTNFWAGNGSVSRSVFQSEHDPDGLFEFDPGFVDQLTLEPDLDLRALVNTTKPDGPIGINVLGYDQTYGAWQYAARSDCAADLNHDGVLSFFDISAFLQSYGVQDPIVDFNEDGRINFFDISMFLAAYSNGCP